MFIHSHSKCSTCFPDIVLVAFSARNQIYDIRQFTSYVFWKVNSVE